MAGPMIAKLISIRVERSSDCEHHLLKLLVKLFAVLIVFVLPKANYVFSVAGPEQAI